MQEYNQVKNELVGLGYSLRQIDEGRAKTRLYRHKPAYNAEGELTDEVGTYTDNVPSEPKYLLRKAQIGMFGFPPGEGCTCKWCAERKGQGAEQSAPEPSGKGKGVMGPHFKTSQV